MEWYTVLWFCSYLLVAGVMMLFGLHRYLIVFLFWKHRNRPPVPAAHFDELPVVTVQLPVFNEMHVVSRLCEAVAKLDYPKEKLEIQILDDSTDDTQAICRAEAEKLSAQGFNAVCIHRTDRTGFKAGALENGLKSAKGAFVCIFDADFVPKPDLLQKAIHFFADPKVGVVQTRWGHLNRNYSLLTRVQALFLDGHHQIEQVARSRTGRFFGFNGTAGLWRRATIDDAGGWEHDTLTEDLDLSYRAQIKGWRFVYLTDLVTPAELPVEMNGFKTQQHRWTKGTIQTCLKVLGKVWKAELPLYVKLEATLHLTCNFAYLMVVPLCFLVFPGAGSSVNFGDESGLLRGLVFDLPIFLLTTMSAVTFYVSSQLVSGRSGMVRNLGEVAALLALITGLAVNNARGILEALFHKPSDFIRTPKYGIVKKGQDWRRAKYRPLKSFAVFLEIGFAFYFSLVVFYAALNFKKYWSSLPFYCIFAFGFWYVAWGSLPLLFPSRLRSQSGPTPGAENADTADQPEPNP